MSETTFWKVRTLAAAAMMLASATSVHAASDVAIGSGALSARASIDFAIAIPKVLEMQLLAHPSTIAVTAEDIARGHLTVSGPAIKLVVNNPRGYNLRAELLHAAFKGVRIAGLQAPVAATRDAPLASMPTMVGRPRPQAASVQYDLELAPDAKPGTYAWPVALSLQEP